MKEQDNSVQLDGTITKILSGSMFRVKLDNGLEILGVLSGRMRQYNIRLAIGDMVKLEMSPYDVTRGRITYRVKDKDRV